MKLEGTLDTFPLRELVEMITYSSVTGVLNIYGPGSSGHLYFRDGNLYHADRGEQRGLDGLAALLELEGGSFAFVSDQVSAEETLWGDLEYHLQTAERLAHRWRQVRPYVPSLDLIPALAMARETAMRRVSPGHYMFFEAVNGTASLRELAAALDWATIDVAEAAAEMALDGVLDLQRNPQPPSATHPNGEGGEGGLFDRILSKAGAALPHPQAVPVPVPASAPGAARAAVNAEDAILRLLRG